VGLGTPRQDGEVVRLAASVGRPALAVGAAFDFVAGTRPEAPVLVQRLALEWLFRLLSEPRRLWPRYTVGIVRFLMVVSGDLLRRP
jgi:N-acetylglucosaminyldiphosphoundecaprenol N-acetyl-beta-D-mannosaminyltransferase